MTPWIYVAVLFIYIGALMGIGIWTGKKTRSAGDFIIGGRSVGPWVTSLSYIAVYFSSVLIIGGGAFGYKYGMATVWIGAINVLVGCTICWMVLGRRVREMTERYGVRTLSGFFARRYNSPEAGVYSAAVIFLFLIIYNVSVVKGMANAFQVLMDLPYWGGVLISGLVIIFYVVIGGYLAVVWTGFIQAWIMIFALLLLMFKTFGALGGLSSGVESLAAIGRQYVETPGVWGWAGLFSFALVMSLGVWGMPQLVIRFYSIKDTKTLRVGTILVTIGSAIAMIPYLVGALSRVLIPNLQNPDLAVPKLVSMVLSPWQGALLLAGVVAAGMSTFAGVLIIISSSLVTDIYEHGFHRKLTGSQEIFGNRLVSAAVGLVSLAIALKPPGLILVLTGFSWAVIASTNLWPLLFGLYSRTASKVGVLVSMIAGTLAALVWTYLKKPFGVDGFITGSSVSLIVLIIFTALSAKGRACPSSST